MREIMTPEQVAGYLQLNKDTVYRLIRQRKLAATRIGRSYRIPKEDLESFLVANSTGPAVRQALFRRVLQIGERNPDLSSDTVLEELERGDHKRRSSKRV
ncbi:MAG: helix-turn-helix domain-containing protein [Chloroflexi bacterium]|nr:helix-turn-helix domain-containing protein [Chloroflexota bacterium]